MIQILGLRDFISADGKSTKREVFFDKKYRSENLEFLFGHPLEVLFEVPPEERYNLYFTVADCAEEKTPGEKGRRLVEQWAIPFDIDHVDLTKVPETIQCALEALGLNFDEIPSLCSGNGVQFFVPLPKPITSEDYFEVVRPHYRALCARINVALSKKHLPGDTDPSVWSTARLMRMPETTNRKPGKEDRKAYMVQARWVAQNFDLTRKSGLPLVEKSEQIIPQALRAFPDPDTKGVLEGCEFLKWAGANPNEVGENQWYAMLSITGRLEDGTRLSHTMSKDHRAYSPMETDAKIEQALKASGPRTCKNIFSLWAGCRDCKHFETKLASPILIQGPDYIKTKSTGFHEQRLDRNGLPLPGKPCYEDLRKFFESKTHYVTINDTKLVYEFSQTHWQEIAPLSIKSFAHDHFNPKPSNGITEEFVGYIHRTNHRTSEWFNESTEEKINLKNGVFCTRTLKLLPHSPQYGFRYVLPYAFDPEAKAPQFEKFLQEVTQKRAELEEIMLEFVGYALVENDCKYQKALMLLGEGSNGKSTFMKVLCALAGPKNFSTVTLKDLQNETSRYQIEGKLFNLAEETSHDALRDTSVFKNLIGGGEILVRRLYHQPYSIISRAKMIFSCNELPKTFDATHAMFRRLLIVRFDRKFSEDEADRHIDGKLKSELPGVFNMALAAYARVRKQGGFSKSKLVEKEIKIYRSETDTVLTFKDEFCEIQALPSELRVSKQAIYDAYKNMCEDRGDKPLNYLSFFKRFSALVEGYEERIVRINVAGARDRAIAGIKIEDSGTF